MLPQAVPASRFASSWISLEARRSALPGSPPESKYVSILASVLFQIRQYSLIGQVDPP